MFQFPGFALKTLCIQALSTWLRHLVCATASLLERGCSIARPFHTIDIFQVGCPIQRSMDQSLFPAPHGLSQGITSFIASCCQGIHQTPFSRLIRSRERQTPIPPRRRFAGLRTVRVFVTPRAGSSGALSRDQKHHFPSDTSVSRR